MALRVNTRQSKTKDLERAWRYPVKSHRIQPDDPEGRPQLKTLTTKVGTATNLETHRFSRFSEWLRLVRAVMCLITVVQNFRKNRANKGTALRSKVYLSISSPVAASTPGDKLKYTASKNYMQINILAM